MDLKSVAEDAYTAYALGDAPNASNAVSIAIKGKELNPEQTQRVCTMVNRKIHKKERSDLSTGQLWKSRWATAKPSEVSGEEVGSQYTRWKSTEEKVEKARADAPKAEKSSAQKTSSARLLDTLSPSYKDQEEISVDIEELFEKREIKEDFTKASEAMQGLVLKSIQDVEDIIRSGQGQLTRAELDVIQAEEVIFSKLSSATSQLGLSFGESLEVLKAAGADAYLLGKSMERFTKESGISEEVMRGRARGEYGDLLHLDIEAASRHWEVRDNFSKSMEKASYLREHDPHVSTIAASLSELSEARERRDLCERAVEKFESDLTSMTSRI